MHSLLIFLYPSDKSTQDNLSDSMFPSLDCQLPVVQSGMPGEPVKRVSGSEWKLSGGSQLPVVGYRI
jgi:hypothetical protein